MNIEGLWDGAYGLSFLSKRTREIICHYKGTYFSSVILNPECWSGGDFRTYDLPHSSPMLNHLSQRVGGQRLLRDLLGLYYFYQNHSKESQVSNKRINLDKKCHYL